MSLRVNVAGGSNAGCRPALKDRHHDWTCVNGHSNKGFATRCLTAGCNVSRSRR